MTIGVLPHHSSRLTIEEPSFEAETRRYRRRVYLLEIVKLSRQNESATWIGPDGVHGLEAARRAKPPDERVLENRNGRFCPALILVGAHLRGSETIDHLVVEIKVRSFK